jgi:hypothetical protein
MLFEIGVMKLGSFVTKVICYPFKKVMTLKDIKWKDIFKHRYGLKVSLYTTPSSFNGVDTSTVSPVISDRPYRRLLTQGYNEWVTANTSVGKLFFTGHKYQIGGLGNIGSVLPHNLRNPIIISLLTQDRGDYGIPDKESFKGFLPVSVDSDAYQVVKSLPDGDAVYIRPVNNGTWTPWETIPPSPSTAFSVYRRVVDITEDIFNQGLLEEIGETIEPMRSDTCHPGWIHVKEMGGSEYGGYRHPDYFKTIIDFANKHGIKTLR